MKPTRTQIRKTMVRVNNLAIKFRKLSYKFDKMCSEYYGPEEYSDHDKDSIIDCLDYGQDTISFEEFDQIMKEINNPDNDKD